MTFDTAWARDLASYCERERERLRAIAAPTQVDWVMLAQIAGDLGVLRLLLGAPEADVSPLLAEAAGATEQVFAMRHTMPAVEEQAAVGGEIDDSLADHALARRALRFALMIANPERARRLAILACDPTLPAGESTEAHLTIALAALVTDERGKLDAALGRLRPPLSPADAAEAAALAALARGNASGFMAALAALIEADRQLAMTEAGATDPDVLIGLAALALTREAERRRSSCAPSAQGMR